MGEFNYRSLYDMVNDSPELNNLVIAINRMKNLYCSQMTVMKTEKVI